MVSLFLGINYLSFAYLLLNSINRIPADQIQQGTMYRIKK